mgnify:CR=1 FL=1
MLAFTVREKLVQASNILRDMAVFGDLPGEQATRQSNALQLILEVLDHEAEETESDICRG